MNCEHLKQEIDLPLYATSLGYEIDRRKSTRHSLVMRLQHSDKIIISKRGGIWVYFSAYDSKDNGTIIDFIQNRTEKTVEQVIKELSSWHGSHIAHLSGGTYAVKEHIPDPNRVNRLFNNCSIAKHHRYLQNRGISEAVLRDVRFEHRVFQDRHQNAVFPHFKGRNVCALELKGRTTSLLVRGSEKTLWRSSIKKTDNCLIVAEAPIDAMSYHIIHSMDKAIYAATSGGFSPLQGRLLNVFIQALKGVEQVILIPDNDQGGDTLTDRFNALMLEANYKGSITRHSPEKRGFDWNDVLLNQQD